MWSKYLDYFYLASPFSLYPDGYEAANKLSQENAAILNDAGINVYAPIAHSYGIAKYSIDSKNVDWLAFDEPFVRNSCGLILLKAASWEISEGMAQEMEWAKDEGIPIIDMKPGKIPEVLFDPAFDTLGRGIAR